MATYSSTLAWKIPWMEEKQYETEGGEDLYIPRAERRLLWFTQQVGGAYNKRLRYMPFS